MRTSTALALSLCLALVASCKADKRLWIESDPPGARVRLDRKLVGTTPYSMEFIHYGTHRLSLDLAGYEPYERDLVVPAPWYARFPLDFFSEVLFPIGWEDHKVAAVKLTPTPKRIQSGEFERVRARAEAFRTAGDAPPTNLPPLNDELGTPLVAVPR
jgi:hypothetical protein